MAHTKIIEAEHGAFSGNWGKFMLLRFDEEWRYHSEIDQGPMLRGRGWSPDHIAIFDLQTGEAAIFRPGGHAGVDLDKHRIWVCPLFLPFLEWLYKQDVSDFRALPSLVALPDAEFAVSGYRRPGPDAAIRLAADSLNLDEARQNDMTRAASQLLALGADLLRRGIGVEEADATLPEIDREFIRSSVEEIGRVTRGAAVRGPRDDVG